MLKASAIQFAKYVAAIALAFSSLDSVAAQDSRTHEKTLRAFASEVEFLSYFEPFAAERQRQQEVQRQRQEEARLRQEAARRKWEAENPGKIFRPAPTPPPAPAVAAPAAAPAASSESITNSQTAGVDEGGIVKVHGKHFVILRRGRLFTVNVDRHTLTPVSAINAFGTDIEPAGAWYDEMLVSGNTVAVIGYSYSRGGTEVGLFNIDVEGQLTYRHTYHIKSNDYYSSRNYASRLIGSKLIFYTPISIGYYDVNPLAKIPGLRRWQPAASASDFKTIGQPTRIYRTDEPLTLDDGGVVMHTIIICDLAKPELTCQSSAALGGYGRTFYVSSQAVYVWTLSYRRNQLPTMPMPAAVFRLPLDGSAPSAIKTQGSPIDQFSFLEDGDGYLNVLVRANGMGDSMWRNEQNSGNLALMRLAVKEFSDGQSKVPESAYRTLPDPGFGSVQNRFVGDHLLYGAGSGWARPSGTITRNLVAVDKRSGTATAIPVPHFVDRIDSLGEHAIAIGTDGKNLHFTSVRLNSNPSIAGNYQRIGASQGETRSHGFFYKPEGDRRGIVGLPIRSAGQGTYRSLWEEPAAMLYLGNSQLQLKEIGSLPTQPSTGRADGCRASCVDWYGNARPIFLAGRVFALMGYELVEGRVLTDKHGQQRLIELRRVNFAPGSVDYEARR
jgi:hypothetical protein